MGPVQGSEQVAKAELRLFGLELESSGHLDEPSCLETLAAALRCLQRLAARAAENGPARDLLLAWSPCVLAAALMSMAIALTQSDGLPQTRREHTGQRRRQPQAPQGTALRAARLCCWTYCQQRMQGQRPAAAALESQLANALWSESDGDAD